MVVNLHICINNVCHCDFIKAKILAVYYKINVISFCLIKQ